MKSAKSYEVLRRSFKKVGCKNVAAELQLCESLIHQWSRGQNGKSAARNPLDVVYLLMQITGDREMVKWLCAQADGFFVPNPKITHGKRQSLMAAECELVKECGTLLAESFQAVAEKELSPARVSRLRADWETVKAVAERFVRLVENGTLWRNLGVQSLRAA